jgi:putative membrane protein
MFALTTVALAAATWWYARGSVRRSTIQLACWLAGCVTLLAAVSPPMERVAHASLTGHMVQHLLIGLIAALLLVLAAPGMPIMAGLPDRLRGTAGALHRRALPLRRLTRTGWWPLAAVGLYIAATWGWHLPAAYDAALRGWLLHGVEHATFLGAGVVLWWTVVQAGRRSAFGYGTGILVVFLAAVQHAGLTSVLMFAPGPLYAQAAGRDDQLLGALVMAVPAKLVYGLAVALLTVAWLTSTERRVARQEGS